MDAWQELSAAEDDALWAAFTERYGFRPGVQPATWPAIREPRGSLTFDLSPLRTGSRRPVAVEDVNSAVLAGCQAICPPEESMVVLDWQHPGYHFWPHRSSMTDPGSWPVPPTPDGDYYVFLTGDLAQGSFGHPWERTLCVFGRDLVAALGPPLSALLPVLRRAGQQAERG